MFDKLFSPLDIGPITLKNRIQVTPHEQNYLRAGLPTETLTHYYLERAKGGAGLLEVSQIFVKPRGDWEHESTQRFPMLSVPEVIPGLRQLSEAVHEYESKIFMEVSAWASVFGPVSPVPFPTGARFPEISLKDISEIQELFGKSSSIVREGGFDGVDLHGTHGAMIEQFLSPLMNKRNDRYGGTFENRLRFLLEVIDVVRSEIGENMALGMRLNADEIFEGGLTPVYSKKIVEAIDGKLDFMNVDRGSVSNYYASDQLAMQTAPLYWDTGYGTYISEPLKAVAKKTKIGVCGRIIDPLMAETILERNQADYVGMLRALIADPELPNKAREGRVDDIRPCIGTMQDCWGRAVSHEWPLRCTVNPGVGFEKVRSFSLLNRVSKPKKVLIIGAGPAGLEAARTAAARGHEVVIYEKSETLGGQLNIAKLLPGRVDVSSIVAWYEVQLKKLGVRLELHKEVPRDIEVLKYLIESEERPNVVILATGSTPLRQGLQMLTFRDVPGWDLPHVFTIDDVLQKRVDLHGAVLVGDSTSYIEGPGVSEWIARNGADEVIFVTPHFGMPPELGQYNQLIHVMKRLHDAGVKVRSNSWIKEIQTSGARVYDAVLHEEETVEAQSVVLNTGRTQDNTLGPLFSGFPVELYEIGDCKLAGGRLRAAIESGYQVASSI